MLIHHLFDFTSAHSTIHLDLDFFVKNESYNILSTSEGGLIETWLIVSRTIHFIIESRISFLLFDLLVLHTFIYLLLFFFKYRLCPIGYWF